MYGYRGYPMMGERMRLYRDTDNALIAGVCAGLADHRQINRTMVRILAVVGLLCFFPVVFIAYVVLACLLPAKTGQGYARAEMSAGAASAGDEWAGDGTRQRRRHSRGDWARDWRWSPGDPGASDRAIAELAERFRDLDRRLTDLERHAVSDEFDLKQKFRDL
ncbi:MAG TPA: PspC domain-containing protein [Stellaceae bacterium]|nr:PspC domain-containing protein [Stellaceae bacterium]